MPPRKGPGRRPIRGKPLKKLSAVLKDPKVPWQRHRVSLWYSPRVRCTIARALLGGGDLVGSRAIGVPLKIAWELGPSPRSGGQDALARAVSEVLKKEPQDTASHEALSRHATKAASRRKPSLRSAAAKKAAVTKGVMLRRFAQSGANAQASHNSVASWEQPCRRSALEHKQDGAEFDGASGDFTVC